MKGPAEVGPSIVVGAKSPLYSAREKLALCGGARKISVLLGHVAAMVPLVFGSRFGTFVSAGKIPFPGNRDFGSKRRGSTG